MNLLIMMILSSVFFKISFVFLAVNIFYSHNKGTLKMLIFAECENEIENC